jgi:hypothetical protein
LEQESSTEKPTLNICPTCEYPLTEYVQCTNQDCVNSQTCDHCGKRLNIYGVCPTKLCLRARCEYCDIHLDIYGICPNNTCPNSMKSRPKDPRPSPDDERFSSATLMPEAPQIVTCGRCNKKYEFALGFCPHCVNREANRTDEPFIEDMLDPDNLDHSLTIPCPNPEQFDRSQPPGVPELPKDPDVSGVHSNAQGFDDEAHSEVRHIDSSAPTMAPPANQEDDQSAPEVEYGVIVINDEEEAALINAERKRLQKEDTA